MKVELAGFTADIEAIQNGDFVSPETIAAAYARISRNPASLKKLRADARKDIEAARKSNSKIVFGCGHSAIAENAVFNVDVEGVSRLAVEAIEHFRLCSFVEKSQRYQKLEDDYVVPDEIMGTESEDIFRKCVTKQLAAYNFLVEEIAKYLQNEAEEKEDLDFYRYKAMEDARYVTPLCMKSQFGMTINAREAEWMISQLRCHALPEVQEFALRLEIELKGIASSLIKHTRGCGGLACAERNIKHSDNISACLSCIKSQGVLSKNQVGTVQCVSIYGYDSLVISALLSQHFNTPNLVLDAHDLYSHDWFNLADFKNVMCELIEGLGPHDPMPRAFELASMTFECSISASCFAQLKRHRMATIIPLDYNCVQPFVVPANVERAGALQAYEDVMHETEAAIYVLYAAFYEKVSTDYLLPQAAMRNVIVHMNLREAYAFCKLRLDAHAQWEIREVAAQMAQLWKIKFPVTACLLAGKDKFEEVKETFLKESKS